MQSFQTVVMTTEEHAVASPSSMLGSGVALAVVVAIHVAIITAILLAPTPPRAMQITEPTIVGVLVSQETEAVQEIHKPLPPVKQAPPPAPAPLPPVKNAPPSEKAISAPPAPEPTPVPQTEAAPDAPVPVAAEAPAAPVAVTPPRSDAAHLNNPAPVYPAMSRRLGEQGRVLLDVYILPNGLVGELRVKVSSGSKRLDDAALQAVKRWKYVPAKRGDEAIPYWYVQPLLFSLNN
jgi:protein TonB